MNIFRFFNRSRVAEIEPAAAKPEPVEQKVVEAAGGYSPEDEGYRRLTGDSKRDLNPITHERMQNVAVHLWRTNPVANRLIELPVAFLLAEGVKLTVPDDEAQGWLDKFWRDPINCMNLKLPQKARELGIYGEQCWPTFVNEVNGHVRLAYQDPCEIATVVTDPDSKEQAIGVVTKKDRKGKTKRFRVIVNGPENVFSERTQDIRDSFEFGDCFYYKVNALSNSSRGGSDLLPQSDVLDGYDKALFGELERWDMLRAFVWDVTIEGGTPDEVEKRAKSIKPPRPGAVRVHNDREKWAAVTPTLNATDTTQLARLIRNQAWSGGSLPEHWFGGGGDVNRATAGEMSEPIMKVLTMRQQTLKHILEEIGTYVIRQRLYHKTGQNGDIDAIADDEKYKVTAEFPELRTRDVTSYAAALQQVISGTAIAVNHGLMSEETAVKLIGIVASGLGIVVDATDELAACRDELSKRQEDDSFPGVGTPEKPPAEEVEDA